MGKDRTAGCHGVLVASRGLVRAGSDEVAKRKELEPLELAANRDDAATRTDIDAFRTPFVGLGSPAMVGLVVEHLDRANRHATSFPASTALVNMEIRAAGIREEEVASIRGESQAMREV